MLLLVLVPWLTYDDAEDVNNFAYYDMNNSKMQT